MARQLVIVESPAKARTINRYLGSRYTVKASMGHIRDLPRKELGVDIENDFRPRYALIPEKKRVVNELQEHARKAEAVFLAADPDREGEAICWHLAALLKTHNSRIYRVLLHEITKKAVTEAFQNLGDLDQEKIEAQQTRRILDRLVGYLISPLLWRKIGRGLSAGRVQSIALRLICEREKAIKDFVPEEFWTIAALLEASEPPSFRAQLSRISGKKAKIQKENQARAIVEELRDLPFLLTGVKVQKKKKNPGPPYITSTLQQDAFRLLRFPVKKTMSVAQRLYEGLEIGDRGLVGLITYMRTDSVRVSDEALRSARAFIQQTFSGEYLPKRPRVFKNKKKAQDAHEAIRPTTFDLPPEVVKPFLKPDEFRLYEMIWKRFVASQMSAARVEETQFEIQAGTYLFTAKGEVLEFDGYQVLYPKAKKEEGVLPKAREGESLRLIELEPKQNFTQPPPRYTEGTLVKELESRGIGRPSTYAPIIATLQDRVYVTKQKGRFIPTDLGLFVTGYLVKNFPDLMDYKFTARMEAELDLISEGKQDGTDSLRAYYTLLQKDLEQAGRDEGIKKKGIPVDETCPECGRQIVIKEGRYGRFRACSGFPECRFRESMVKKDLRVLDEACPECGSALVVRRGKYGTFVACSNYPKCTFVKKEKKDTGIACPEGCGGTLVRRKTKKGKVFYGCSRYPECTYATWHEPVKKPCPRCGRPFLFMKKSAGGTVTLACSDKECGYEESGDAAGDAQSGTGSGDERE